MPSRRRSSPPVLVSAHRCGAGEDRHLENTLPALEAALALEVDFVEFDVQRCADGTFVLFHDDEVEVDGRRTPLVDLLPSQLEAVAGPVLGYEEVLAALAGRCRAHIDLKFTSPSAAYVDAATTHEVRAARRAVEVLGADNLVVTTLEDASVRAVRDWADDAGLDLLVGLSLGRSVRGLPVVRQVRTRWSWLVTSNRPGVALDVRARAAARMGR